jgi:hypothetical protein
VVLGIIAVMVAVKVLVEVTISDFVIVCTKLTEAEAVMVPLTRPDTTADCEAVAVLVTIDVTVPVKMPTSVPVGPVGVSTGHEVPLTDVAPDETVPVPGFAVAVDEVGESAEHAANNMHSDSMENPEKARRVRSVMPMTSFSSRFGSNRSGERTHQSPLDSHDKPLPWARIRSNGRGRCLWSIHAHLEFGN